MIQINNKKAVLFFIPTIVFTIAYFATRSDLALSTAVSNFALPTVIIQMLMLTVAAYWKKKQASKALMALSAVALIVMVSSVGFAQAGIAGSLLSDPAYIQGDVRVYINPNMDGYGFWLNTDSATYFKNEAQRTTNDAQSYIGIFGSGTIAGFATNWFTNYIKLPAKYNPLGAIIAGIATGLTIVQIRNMNQKIQQDYSPTNGIALYFSHQNVQIYNWYGYRWEVLYNGDEYVSYACNRMAQMYGTGNWATYHGCEIIYI